MTAIVTDRYRVQNAKQFFADFSTAGNSFYTFAGRSHAWSNDLSPPIPDDNLFSNQYDIFDDMIVAKRVQTTDVCPMVRRYNWTSGTVYDVYDDQDVNLYRKVFFVITDELKVYKCLDRPAATASTVKPTAVTTNIARSGDGYVWKYMYTLASADHLKFSTNLYIPARGTGAVVSPTGSVNSVFVVTGGTGYATAPAVNVVSGNGTGFTATATVSAGVVTRIDVTAQGSGYTYLTLSLTGGGGTGATVRAVLSPINHEITTLATATGHGSEPIAELGGYYVGVATRFETSESGLFPVSISYRKIGLLRNPWNFATSGTLVRSTASVVRQTIELTLSGAPTGGTFANNDTINQGAASARVVWFDSTNNKVYINGIRGTFTTGSITNGTASGTVTAVGNPGFLPVRSNVLYVETRTPINRGANQAEDFRYIIEF